MKMVAPTASKAASLIWNKPVSWRIFQVESTGGGTEQIHSRIYNAQPMGIRWRDSAGDTHGQGFQLFQLKMVQKLDQKLPVVNQYLVPL